MVRKEQYGSFIKKEDGVSVYSRDGRETVKKKKTMIGDELMEMNDLVGEHRESRL